MLRAAVFDLDGTLLNTLDDLTDSVNVTLARFDRPAVSSTQVRAALGGGGEKLFERVLVKGREDERFADMLAFFVPYYAQHCREKTAPYPGLMDTLQLMQEKQVKMAIVSNKADSAVRILAEAFFADMVTVAVGAKEGIRKKPCPDTVLEAMRLLGAKPEETLYIGDSEVDLDTARNAGIAVALVTWGFRDREQLAPMQPEYLIDEPAQLAQLFE